jgi:hypothetical protein
MAGPAPIEPVGAASATRPVAGVDSVAATPAIDAPSSVAGIDRIEDDIFVAPPAAAPGTDPAVIAAAIASATPPQYALRGYAPVGYGDVTNRRRRSNADNDDT